MASDFIGVKLEGVQGFLNKARALVPSTRAAVRQAVAETALLLETDAKQFAPVDTGRLRASIHTEVSSDGLSATVEAGVDYAVFLEFGTRYIQPRPFLGPAYEKNRLPFIARLKAAGLSIKP